MRKSRPICALIHRPSRIEEGATGRVAVVTDSAADLTPALAAAAGVRVVPLTVRFGGEESRVGVDLSSEQFWARLLAPAAPYPATASPPPGLFRATFEACFAEGADAIVCPTIGAKLSGTFQSATLAAQDLPGREIHVIDTGSTSMATGFPALLAAEMAAAGASAAQIAATLRARLADIDFYAAARHPRLPPQGRPPLGGGGGDRHPPLGQAHHHRARRAGGAGGAPRTRARARARVIELVSAQPIERLAVMHTPTSTREEVEAFRDALVARVPGGVDPAHVSVGLIGASTGPHLGPNLMGAVFLRRRWPEVEPTAADLIRMPLDAPMPGREDPLHADRGRWQGASGRTALEVCDPSEQGSAVEVSLPARFLDARLDRVAEPRGVAGASRFVDPPEAHHGAPNTRLSDSG